MDNSPFYPSLYRDPSRPKPARMPGMPWSEEPVNPEPQNRGPWFAPPQPQPPAFDPHDPYPGGILPQRREPVRPMMPGIGDGTGALGHAMQTIAWHAPTFPSSGPASAPPQQPSGGAPAPQYLDRHGRPSVAVMVPRGQVGTPNPQARMNPQPAFRGQPMPRPQPLSMPGPTFHPAPMPDFSDPLRPRDSDLYRHLRDPRLEALAARPLRAGRPPYAYEDRSNPLRPRGPKLLADWLRQRRMAYGMAGGPALAASPLHAGLPPYAAEEDRSNPLRPRGPKLLAAWMWSHPAVRRRMQQAHASSHSRGGLNAGPIMQLPNQSMATDPTSPVKYPVDFPGLPDPNLSTEPGSYLQPTPPYSSSISPRPPAFSLEPGSYLQPNLPVPAPHFAGVTSVDAPLPGNSGGFSSDPLQPAHPPFHEWPQIPRAFKTDPDSPLQPAPSPVFKTPSTQEGDFRVGNDPHLSVTESIPDKMRRLGATWRIGDQAPPFASPSTGQNAHDFISNDLRLDPQYSQPPLPHTDIGRDPQAPPEWQRPVLDDETYWGKAGPGTFADINAKPLPGSQSGFLKKYGTGPNLPPDPTPDAKQANPLLDPSAVRLDDTPDQYEDYVPKPGAVKRAYRFDAGYGVDADAAAKAYNPEDTGLDRLANARSSDGTYKEVLVYDKNGSLHIQGPEEPAPGYYTSKTTREDDFYPEHDLRRYANSDKYPYVVRDKAMEDAGVEIGDFATIYNLETGQYQHAIVADKGPGGTLGEVSIEGARGVGLPSNPRTSGVIEKKEHKKALRIIVYPGSRMIEAGHQRKSDESPNVIPTPQSIQARGEAYFKAAGHKLLQGTRQGDPLAVP